MDFTATTISQIIAGLIVAAIIGVVIWLKRAFVVKGLGCLHDAVMWASTIRFTTTTRLQRRFDAGRAERKAELDLKLLNARPPKWGAFRLEDQDTMTHGLRNLTVGSQPLQVELHSEQREFVITSDAFWLEVPGGQTVTFEGFSTSHGLEHGSDLRVTWRDADGAVVSSGCRLLVARAALAAEVAEHDELALATREQIAGFVAHCKAVSFVGSSGCEIIRHH